jgi:hypothetical protein
MICYRGKCVNKISVLNYTLPQNPCESNPCKNGGKCSTSSSPFICECPFEYSGKIKVQYYFGD